MRNRSDPTVRAPGSLLLATTVLLAGSLAGCGTAPQPPAVGVLQFSDSQEALAGGITFHLEQQLDRHFGAPVLMHRNARGDEQVLMRKAAELVDAGVDVIAAIATPAALAARQQAVGHDIPVVFTVVSEPVEAGLVDSRASPGLGATGVMGIGTALAGKALETLVRSVPGLRRVLMLYVRDPSFAGAIRKYRDTAAVLDIELREMEVASTAEAVAAYRRSRPGDFEAVIELSEPMITAAGDELLALSKRLGVPAIRAGGPGLGATMALGVDRFELGRQTATMVTKVLTGTPVGDLPVELPRRVVFMLFQERAQAIGYEFSPAALQLADTIEGLEPKTTSPRMLGEEP
ncbi:MAG: ABC transporter substrate binding protein [Vicinamibacterales bacterium]|jgi:putative ABC transport system substrate-binding protein|nr:ABC transporter substrate binding protein [Vicinamibacterales bacterium]